MGSLPKKFNTLPASSLFGRGEGRGLAKTSNLCVGFRVDSKRLETQLQEQRQPLAHAHRGGKIQAQKLSQTLTRVTRLITKHTEPEHMPFLLTHADVDLLSIVHHIGEH